MFFRTMILLWAILFMGQLVRASTGPEVERLTTEGMRLVREGRLEQGIGLLQQASNVNPSDPSVHVKLGGVLYEYAQGFFGAGESLQAQMVLRNAERELRTAVDLLPDAEAALRADCAFLVGEIYTRGYGYREAARRWYEKALEDNINHTGAQNVIKSLDAAYGPVGE